VVLLTLEADGLEGWSECVALAQPTYTYETTDTAWQILTEILLPVVVGTDCSDPAEVLRRAEGVRGHPMAKATVEMAAWDLTARVRGKSLADLLGGSRKAVPVGVSVGIVPTIEELVEQVAGYVEDGYRRVKVKIARGKDLSVLQALRRHFPDIELWADANSAYSLNDVPLLRTLGDTGLGLIEEPLAPGDFVGYARLQELIEVPICLDESIVTERDAAVAAELGSCRSVNLKPGRVGGLGPARRIHDQLSDLGIAVWCGGMLESGVGRAHLLALASLPGFDLPGDISASRRYWARDIVSPEFEVVAGEMVVPTGPGIGVTVDVERVEALTTRRADFG
jgi:O-succinylbenzoate synthase